MSRAKIADALRDVAFSGATERERSRLLLSELASIVRDGYRASSDDPHRHLREWWKAHSEDLVETDRMAAIELTRSL